MSSILVFRKHGVHFENLNVFWNISKNRYIDKYFYVNIEKKVWDDFSLKYKEWKEVHIFRSNENDFSTIHMLYKTKLSFNFRSFIRLKVFDNGYWAHTP